MSRIVMMGTGSALMCGLIIIAALLIPMHKPVHVHHHVRCTRDFYIAVHWNCGNKIYNTNPDGTRVFIGSTSNMSVPASHHLYIDGS